MSRIKRRSRRATVLATVVGLALAGVAAFAYWTTSGEGSGEVHVKNPTEHLKVTSTPVEGLYPGASVEQTVTVQNTSATESIHVSTLETALTGNSNEATGCEKKWFTVTPNTQSILGELKPGESLSAKVKVAMSNPTEENQNACKGATVNLHFLAQ
jgi:hypothetical protein